MTDVSERLIEHLRQRAAFGADKYGKRLVPFDGRNTLRDALEEVLDLAVYITKEMMERAAIADLMEQAATFVEFISPQLSTSPEEVISELRETAARMRQDIKRIGPEEE